MRIALFFNFITWLLCLTGYSQSARRFDLQDCINYALTHNEELRIATLENDISLTHIKEVFARGLPQIDGNIEIVNNLDIQRSFIQDFITPASYAVLINTGLLPPSTVIPEPETFPAAFGTNFSGFASVKVKQLIFDGSFFVGLQASREAKQLSKAQEQEAKVKLIEAVSKTYYLVLISQENVEYASSTFASLDSLYKETQLLYTHGFAEKIDVSRLKIEHNNAKTNLISQTNLLVVSIQLLKFQMGMPINEPLYLNDVLLSSLVINLDMKDTQASWLMRPEYKVLNTSQSLLKLNVKNYKAQYIPNIYANFNYGWTAGQNTFNELTKFDNTTWLKYSNLSLRMSIPIFDGLRKSALIQRNQIEIQKVQYQVDQFKNNVEREISETNINLSNAMKNIETQKENMQLAEEVYRLTAIKYKEGVGANLEVVEANTALQNTKANYLNALYEGLIKQIELKKAMGILNEYE